MSQGLPSPPLSREEFASLRDGAKGLLHRIPAEHKAKLIELGYVEEIAGGIRITSHRQNENCRRQVNDKPLRFRHHPLYGASRHRAAPRWGALRSEYKTGVSGLR